MKEELNLIKVWNKLLPKNSILIIHNEKNKNYSYNFSRNTYFNMIYRNNKKLMIIPNIVYANLYNSLNVISLINYLKEI